MTVPLSPSFDFSRRSDLVDDGGRPLDALLCLTAEVAAAVDQAVARGLAVMPAGGLTSAINAFDYDRRAVRQDFAEVVALRPKGAATPEVVPAEIPLERLLSHQVAIDVEKGWVAAGAGLTYTQVNMVLEHLLGPTARLLVDLTSTASASVGGVVATGGMGPLRMPPSTFLKAVSVADGAGARVIEGDAILDLEGLQGWTGMITAVRMRWFEVPPQEFGLVLPVQGSDIDALADLLAYLHPWTTIAIPTDGNVLAAGDGGTTIVNGVELITRPSLEQFVAHAADPARSKAEGLLQACDYAGADTLACLTGWSELPVEDVLGVLLDEATETIGGIPIDFGVGFSSGTEMDIFRAIREGAPDLARTQARVTPPGKLKPWTTSTDVNVAAPPSAGAIAALLQAYADYRAAIAALAERFAGRVEVTLSAYGHLSPQGIDPHHRVTLVAAEGCEEALAEARAGVAAEKKRLIAALVDAAERHGCLITGGEKGMPSILDVARAVGDNRLPANLRDRIARARRAVAAAPAAFSFRAPKELKS